MLAGRKKESIETEAKQKKQYILVRKREKTQTLNFTLRLPLERTQKLCLVNFRLPTWSRLIFYCMTLHYHVSPSIAPKTCHPLPSAGWASAPSWLRLCVHNFFFFFGSLQLSLLMFGDCLFIHLFIYLFFLFQFSMSRTTTLHKLNLGVMKKYNKLSSASELKMHRQM